jgi:hypothetical protein
MCEPCSDGKLRSPCPFIDIFMRNRDPFMLLGRNSPLGEKGEATAVLPVVMILGLPNVRRRAESMIKNRYFFVLCWKRFSFNLRLEGLQPRISLLVLEVESQNREIAASFKEPSMATVITHIHFCPRCDDTWTCVSWVCQEEDGELTCQLCRVKSLDEPKPVQTLAESDTQQKDCYRLDSNGLECDIRGK